LQSPSKDAKPTRHELNQLLIYYKRLCVFYAQGLQSVFDIIEAVFPDGVPDDIVESGRVLLPVVAEFR
jgi:hypothetical protein